MVAPEVNRREANASGEVKKEPSVETDAFRIWKAGPVSAEEKAWVEDTSLSIREGEKIHEAVVVNLGGGYTVKLLSKERKKDGLLELLTKAEAPDGSVNVVRSDGWLTREQYNALVAVVREVVGNGCMSVIRGEDIEAGVEQVGGRREKDAGRCGEERGTPCPSAPDLRKGRPIKKQGGDSNGG